MSQEMIARIFYYRRKKHTTQNNDVRGNEEQPMVVYHCPEMLMVLNLVVSVIEEHRSQ